MWAAMVRKEVQSHLASFRFWVGAGLAIVLAASSAWIASRDFNLRLRAYQERAADEERKLGAISVYSFLQPAALRPPEPLSVLDQGFDSRLGTAVPIHLSAIPFEATGIQRGNELLAGGPAVDLTTVVSVVLGLLAMLLTCDAITGEREDGMLRAILAHGGRRWAVLAGKAAGAFLTLSLPLAAGLLASLSVHRWVVRRPLTSDQWLRVAGLAGAYLGYLLLMLLLGLLISASVRSSSRALGASVLVWFVLAIAVPVAARTLAGHLVRPEVVRQETERDIARLVADSERRLARELRRVPLLATMSGYSALSFSSGEFRAVRYRYGTAPYYESLADYYRLERKEGLRLAVEVYRVRQRYEARLREGERLGSVLASVSPAFLLSRLSQAFAGTSVEDYDRFLALCRDYRLRLLSYLDLQGAWRTWRWFTDDPPAALYPWPRFLGLAPQQVEPAEVSRLFSRLSEPAVEARLHRDRERIRQDPSRRLSLRGMPRFSYPGPLFLRSLAHASPALAALAGLNLLVAFAAGVRFRRAELG